MTRLIDDLAGVLGDGLMTDEMARAARARDSWMRSQIPLFAGTPVAIPVAVAAPADAAELSEVVRICRAHRAPMIPRGGGSGVVGGVLASSDSVIISTERMAGLRSLSSPDLLATFGAGTNGLAAEQLVNDAGLTIGHWPQSIEQSTVGGWVATRASGQYSTAYGNIEDLVHSLEAVLPDGSIYRSRRTPRASAGPDLRQLLLGSEGVLGVITEVTFSLRPLPEGGVRQAFHFPDFARGIDATREVVRVGWRPPVVRLYDERESHRHFPDDVPDGNAVLILLHEGPPGVASIEARAVEEICRSRRGESMGRAAADTWFENRNTVPTWTDLLEQGVVADTIEVATTWTSMVRLHDEVLASLDAIPEVVGASAHSSHAYRSGANLYFTFAAVPRHPTELIAVYDRCWDAAMRAANERGAGLAHHHGIGRVRRDWLASELDVAGMSLLQRVKAAIDPEGLMNPGVLLPPGR